MIGIGHDPPKKGIGNRQHVNKYLMFKGNSAEVLSPIPDEVYCFAEWQKFSPRLALKSEPSPEEKNQFEYYSNLTHNIPEMD